MPKQPTKPSWNDAQTLGAAKPLAELLETYEARLAPRLPQGFRSTYRELLSQFETAAAGKPVVLTQQKSATEQLASAIRDAIRDAGAIRNAVRNSTDDKAVHRLFGIGARTGSGTLGNALSAFDAVIEAMEARSNDLHLFGLTPADLDAAKASRKNLIDIDLAQEGQKGKKTGATQSKLSLQKQLITATRRLIGAAEIEFRAEPEILARFRAPVPPRGGKKVPAPAPAPA